MTDRSDGSSKKKGRGPRKPRGEQPTAPKAPVDSSVSYVSLIQDPYGIRSQEISDAQESSEELPLEEIRGEEDEGSKKVGSRLESEIRAAEESAEADAPLESDPNAAWADALSPGDDEPPTDPTLNAAEAALNDEESEEDLTTGIDIARLRRELAEDKNEFKPAPDTGELEKVAEAMAEQEELARQAASEIAEWVPDAEAERKAAEAHEQVLIAEDRALQAEEARGKARHAAQPEAATAAAEPKVQASAAPAQEPVAPESEEAEDEVDHELEAALPHPNQETGELDLAEVQSCLEALLFMLDRPASFERLRELLGPDFPLAVVQEAMTALKDRYRRSAHGIEIVEVAGGVQFRTKPGRAPLARRLAKVQTKRLSSGAMETLAIIAYRQPAMKEDIDRIRGVDSSYFVKNLLDHKLIAITGRSELPGRPMLYSTTDEFLTLFSLKDLSSMPSLREIEQMIPASQTGKGDEDPRVREMRRLVNQMTTDTSTTLAYDPNEDEKILKEIKERVSAIPTSTPYLDEQKAAEKAAKELAVQQAKAAAAGAAAASGESGDTSAGPELPLGTQGANAGAPEPLPPQT